MRRSRPTDSIPSSRPLTTMFSHFNEDSSDDDIESAIIPQQTTRRTSYNQQPIQTSRSSSTQSTVDAFNTYRDPPVQLAKSNTFGRGAKPPSAVPERLNRQRSQEIPRITREDSTSRRRHRAPSAHLPTVDSPTVSGLLHDAHAEDEEGLQALVQKLLQGSMEDDDGLELDENSWEGQHHSHHRQKQPLGFPAPPSAPLPPVPRQSYHSQYSSPTTLAPPQSRPRQSRQLPTHHHHHHHHQQLPQYTQAEQNSSTNRRISAISTTSTVPSLIFSEAGTDLHRISSLSGKSHRRSSHQPKLQNRGSISSITSFQSNTSWFMPEEDSPPPEELSVPVPVRKQAEKRSTFGGTSFFADSDDDDDEEEQTPIEMEEEDMVIEPSRRSQMTLGKAPTTPLPPIPAAAGNTYEDEDEILARRRRRWESRRREHSQSKSRSPSLAPSSTTTTSQDFSLMGCSPTVPGGDRGRTLNLPRLSPADIPSRSPSANSSNKSGSTTPLPSSICSTPSRRKSRRRTASSECIVLEALEKMEAVMTEIARDDVNRRSVVGLDLPGNQVSVEGWGELYW